MRIAHVSDCYLPRTGGIETQVRALALQQRDAGHEVMVLTATPDGEPAMRMDRIDGLPVARIAMRLPAELPVHPRAAHHVRAVLSRHPVDVVHVHAGVVSPFAWPAIRAATRMGLPVLVTVHSVWGGMARPGFSLADAVLRWSRWGAQLSAVSAVAAARIEAAAAASRPVLVVPNGIDPQQWGPLPLVPGDPGVLRVAAVMRLAPRKRLGALLEMVGDASATLPPGLAIEAVVAGDGPQRARAEAAIRRRDLPVRLAGRLDRDAIRALFAASDVFVQPSVRESFGLAALEARTSGLPVLVRAQAGSTEFVRDQVEGLVAADDRGMAASLVRLARDRDLLDRIAAHNRGVPPEQAWPAVLAVVSEAYAAAAARRHA